MRNKSLFLMIIQFINKYEVEKKMKHIMEEFGGALLYAVAGGSMLGIFVYLIQRLLG